MRRATSLDALLAENEQVLREVDARTCRYLEDGAAEAETAATLNPIIQDVVGVGAAETEERPSADVRMTQVFPNGGDAAPGGASAWQTFSDRESGCAYYHNCVTGETSWTLPEEARQVLELEHARHHATSV